MEACQLLVYTLLISRLVYRNTLLCGVRDDVYKQP